VDRKSCPKSGSISCNAARSIRFLPNLIERTLQRGWRAAVQATSQERLAAIDDLLWTFAEESFLAHGSAAQGDPELQPVWLTLGPDNPNGSQVRFLLEGAAPILSPNRITPA